MVDVVTRDVTAALTSYCQTAVGQDLRAVTRYSLMEHDRVYTRGDILDQLDLEDEMREMFRVPLMQMHNAILQFTRVHPTITEASSAVFNFGHITVVQLPVTTNEGIIVTLDRNDDLQDEFVSECEAIVTRNA